jgi:hypothetical protein
MEQKLACQNFIKQTAKGPDIGGPGRANLFPPVVVIGFLLGLEGQREHFWRLDTLSSP